MAGDLSIRARVSLDDWMPAVQNQILGNTNTGVFNGFGLRNSTSNVLLLEWGNGAVIMTSQTPPLSFADGSYQTIWVTLDVDDGAGNHVVTFYTSPDDGQTWEQIDQNVVAGTTVITGSPQPLQVGQRPTGTLFTLDGKVDWIEVAGDLAHTDLRASPNFAKQPIGTTQFTDAQGNVWTLQGNATIGYVT